MQTLHSATEQYPADAAQQGQTQGQGQSHAPALQSLSRLLQQALAQLLEGAVAAFAALPVMGRVQGRQEGRPLLERLLALLGQVSWAIHTDRLLL